jgi:hypothetical protein
MLVFKCASLPVRGSDRIQAGQRSRGSPATGGTGGIGGRGRLIYCKPTLAMQQLLLLSQRKVNLITISVKQFFSGSIRRIFCILYDACVKGRANCPRRCDSESSEHDIAMLLALASTHRRPRTWFICSARTRPRAQTHRDPHFQGIRPEFQIWVDGEVPCYAYLVYSLPVEPEDSRAGSPTKMGMFEKDGQ